MSTTNEESSESSRDNDIKHVGQLDQNKLESLRSMREKVDWKVKDERLEFLRQLDPMIKTWKGQLPNLRDIFRPEEIDTLLSDSVKDRCRQEASGLIQPGYIFIKFVADSGYEDEPKVDKDGKPSSRRTTALHHSVRGNRCIFITKNCFRIYNRYDVNYVDELGFSHFHAACKVGHYLAAKKFLESGQDINCIMPETGDSPLHLAVRSPFGNESQELNRFLLESGANPNLPNAHGLTPLHNACQRTLSWTSYYLMQTLFEHSIDEYQPLQVDARDKWGNTPLHYLLSQISACVDLEILLTKGPNPNFVNKNGSTPLHIICKKNQLFYEENLSKVFFKIYSDMQQTIQVDVVDKLGRTPLQWAVANLLVNEVDVLLDNGADLASFVFPSESYFAKGLKQRLNESVPLFKLRIASSALIIMERLERSGYEFDRSEALMIMKFFANYGLFEKSADLEICWFDDEELTKEIMIKPDLSLHNLLLQEAEKRLAYSDYFKLASSDDWLRLSLEFEKFCTLHLCEIMSRRFFWRWTMDPFLELIHYRLPILCCDMIFDTLMNEDLYNICLAATRQSS